MTGLLSSVVKKPVLSTDSSALDDERAFVLDLFTGLALYRGVEEELWLHLWVYPSLSYYCWTLDDAIFELFQTTCGTMIDAPQDANDGRPRRI